MPQVWKPANTLMAYDAVNDALLTKSRLELIGRGTRRGLGRPVEAEVVLDLSALSGVVTYEPEELVVTVLPGTPLAELERQLARKGQQLAFEAPDWGPLWGEKAGAGTIAGAALTGLGGPRRLTVGGPRDHCLGVKGVNGFGDSFAAGGRVVKNVTGFDLTKLVCGSFGTLAVVTELTFKTTPTPPHALTIAVRGLDDEAAVRVMAQAMGTSATPSAAAHLPADVARDFAGGWGQAMTLLRLEGVKPSVAARAEHLRQVLGEASIEEIGGRESAALWKQIADAAVFAGRDTVIWKLSTPPTLGARVGRRLADRLGGRCFYDWAGGAVWLELAAIHEAEVRGKLAEAAGRDGHATLIRAPEADRRTAEPFQPLEPALAALSGRVKKQFDPQGLFNPGRMYGAM